MVAYDFAVSFANFKVCCNEGADMASLATAEACDTNAALLASGDLRVLQPVFQIYGQCRAFSGPIFEDNVLALETKGEGKVLIIDGGGNMRRRKLETASPKYGLGWNCSQWLHSRHG